MTPIILYLKDGKLSEGKGEANNVLREVYEGDCGNHLGARSLIHKVVRVGYY